MQVYKVQLIGILAIAHCAFTLDNIFSYVNKDYKFPKCCEHGSHLILDNSTLLCREGQYLKSQIGFKYNNDSDHCIDFLFEEYTLIIVDRRTLLHKNLTNVIKYPKCCPLGFGYDNKEHKCVLYSDRSNVDEADGLFIEVGLSKCKSSSKSVIDYLLDNSSLIIEQNLSIQLDDGKKVNYEDYCFDVNIYTGEKIVRICQNYEDVCQTGVEDDGIPCYKKCCPDGESYLGNKCTPTFDTGILMNDPRLKERNNSDNYGIIHTQYCKKYIATVSVHNFYIDGVGRMNVEKHGHWKLYNSNDAPYCIETLNRKVQYIFLCFSEDSTITFKLTLKAIFMGLSIIFVSLTLIIYIILPEMRNLYGKCLMTFFATLIMGYSFMAYTYIYDNPPFCVEIGFIISFFMIAFFTWLNVISFDMWVAFSQMRTISSINKEKDVRRFLYYNMYAWGVPVFCTAVTIIVYKTECLPSYLVPHIGVATCFFDKFAGTYDLIIYFLIPETILVISNCIFFIKTVIYCTKVKNEINRMKNGNREKSKRTKKFNQEKEKLAMFLKLGIIMGVSWLFEVVSTFISFKNDPTLQIVEYVWDCFNALTGVFIFGIFILKKKILKALRKKLGGNIGRLFYNSTLTSTSSNVTQLKA